MKILSFGSSFFLASLLFFEPCVAWERPAPGSVSPEKAAQLLQYAKGSLVILDVRTPAEFQSGHAGEALNIPLSELPSRINEIPKDRPILILCRSGNRASRAFAILRDAGYPEDSLWYLSGYTDYSSGSPRFHR
ncbi:MAG: rhodanese-like domain-containing protein [Mailhella sp.]